MKMQMETEGLIGLDQQKTFWLNQLEQGASILELPKSRLQNSGTNNAAGSMRLVFSSELVRDLNAFCEQQQCTKSSVLVSALRAMIFRYTRQQNTVLSALLTLDDATVSQNALALLHTIDGQASMVDLIRHFNAALPTALQHSDFPFEELRNALIAGQKFNVAALNELAFSFHTDRIETKEWPGLEHPGDWLDTFDLCFFFAEKEGRLILQIHYNDSIYDREVISRMSRHIENILKQLFLQPDAPIATIKYLTGQENKELLLAFNQTSFPFPTEKTIVDLFTDQAKTTPNNIALVADEQQLTYQQLDHLSNQLAHYLVDHHKVQLEDLIGVKTERSEWLLVALIAVMKTGAAYVPIDPAYPQERINYIEKDSNCKITIDEELIRHFQSLQSQYSTDALTVTVPADSLAYVIYTSGSTGNPKGVMIYHQSAVAMIAWAKEEFDLSRFDIVYAVTSHCFDLSVYEFFFTLATGKKIRMIKSALNIQDYLSKDQNILINTVPSVIKQLLDGEVDMSAVTVLNMAGEPIPVNTIRKLDKSQIEVRNLYGPSEDTTYSSCYKFEDRRYSIIPIGKPIHNTCFYLLDEQLELLPKGCIGELFISGDGLAKGYLGQPGLTAEKFIPNPFIPNTLMYRTGDLARYEPDGNMEFLGRKDKQVKLRGYRIELGEIEDQLVQQKDLIKAAVVLIREVKREKNIVAYVVPQGDLVESEIRERIQQFLPKFMLPSYFVALENIPLTPNGKTDVNALPEVNPALIASKNYVAPATELQKELVAMWEKLLRVDKVGIADSFFERGGNSLMAIKMINKINKQYKVSMSVEYFFDAETIQNISGLIQLQMEDESTENENVEELTI